MLNTFTVYYIAQVDSSWCHESGTKVMDYDFVPSVCHKANTLRMYIIKHGSNQNRSDWSPQPRIYIEKATSIKLT
jgi:hypothetical protein